MYAMQYEITLPADYDMKVIRDRVATRGHLMDAYEGLGLKAFLIRERGLDGSPVNQYAPFYLWDDTGGMNRFLWGGGGFGGIVEDFGRPAVDHWTGVAFGFGAARDAPPRGASRLRRTDRGGRRSRDRGGRGGGGLGAAGRLPRGALLGARRRSPAVGDRALHAVGGRRPGGGGRRAL